MGGTKKLIKVLSNIYTRVCSRKLRHGWAAFRRNHWLTPDFDRREYLRRRRDRHEILYGIWNEPTWFFEDRQTRERGEEITPHQRKRAHEQRTFLRSTLNGQYVLRPSSADVLLVQQ